MKAAKKVQKYKFAVLFEDWRFVKMIKLKKKKKENGLIYLLCCSVNKVVFKTKTNSHVVLGHILGTAFKKWNEMSYINSFWNTQLICQLKECKKSLKIFKNLFSSSILHKFKIAASRVRIVIKQSLDGYSKSEEHESFIKLEVSVFLEQMSFHTISL